MGDPRQLSSDQFEIVAPREIRKAGIDLTDLRLLRRIRLVDAEGEAVGFALDISADLVVGDEIRPTLIVCRSEPDPLAAYTIDAVRDSAVRGGASHAIIFSASGYEDEAVRRGRVLGIALLVVADGRAAFARSAWASGPTPNWVPEYMAEAVIVDVAGLTTTRLITTGHPELILHQLMELEPAQPPDDDASSST